MKTFHGCLEEEYQKGLLEKGRGPDKKPRKRRKPRMPSNISEWKRAKTSDEATHEAIGDMTSYRKYSTLIKEGFSHKSAMDKVRRG